MKSITNVSSHGRIVDVCRRNNMKGMERGNTKSYIVSLFQILLIAQRHGLVIARDFLAVLRAYVLKKN